MRLPICNKAANCSNKTSRATELCGVHYVSSEAMAQDFETNQLMQLLFTAMGVRIYAETEDHIA